jgi:Tfp pilus assembly protein PilO
MIFNSFFTQIIMVVLAVGMLLFYVKPTMTEIGMIQDSILKHKEERAKAENVNAKLAALVSEVNSISASNMKALSTYLPDTIDDAAVMRDVYNITELSKVTLKDIGYTPGVSTVTYTPEGEPVSNGPSQHEFSVSVFGEYEDIKTFLTNLESSNYPLEVHSFKLLPNTQAENLEEEEVTTNISLLSAEMTLVTYSHLAGNKAQ